MPINSTLLTIADHLAPYVDGPVVRKFDLVFGKVIVLEEPERFVVGKQAYLERLTLKRQGDCTIDQLRRKAPRLSKGWHRQIAPLRSNKLVPWNDSPQPEPDVAISC